MPATKHHDGNGDKPSAGRHAFGKGARLREHQRSPGEPTEHSAGEDGEHAQALHSHTGDLRRFGLLADRS